jgi:hypothetical protein
MLAIRSAIISGRSSLRVPARSLRASAHHGAMNHTSAILWAFFTFSSLRVLPVVVGESRNPIGRPVRWSPA